MLTPELAIGLLVFIGFVFSIVVHEVAHALVASWCGDDTGRLLGRITLNPVAHIDPFMSVLLPGAMLLMSQGRMVFGGAKPVPVNVYNLRHPRRDMMWVALAGPVSNVLLAVAFTLSSNLLYFVNGADPRLAASLAVVLIRVVSLNLLLACFNMIPVPPLDGSRVLSYFLPPELALGMAKLERWGLLIVVILVSSGIAQPVLKPAIVGTSWLFGNLPVPEFIRLLFVVR